MDRCFWKKDNHVGKTVRLDKQITDYYVSFALLEHKIGE